MDDITKTAIEIISHAGYDVYLKQKNMYVLYDINNMKSNTKTYTKNELIDYANDLSKLL